MSKKDKNKNTSSDELDQILDQDVAVDQQEEASKETDLEKAQRELQEEKDKFLRLFAEFENFKKRTSRERVELFKTAGEEVIQSLLPVLDDFDRALKEIDRAGDDGLFEGVTLIHNKLKETLKSKGLQPIEIAAGTTFDADLHEAVTQIPAPTDDLKGKIIDVIEKGYTLGDKIIRYPKVVIGQQ
ncbi:nucleotide exchange factor GrpE [Gilvibacter sediminis]|uniref:nucleotide exchange factor GrpE n=1 Tax=Gilvibacter sediminis TaxID=379071 RepID=UPI0023501105|nr:nucleotide exchange factor GrpE [Gilvibacter sediminis]MDC7999315.1 nucleotide exchange factor GrpE [Gilvibacter sediminis]